MRRVVAIRVLAALLLTIFVIPLVFADEVTFRINIAPQPPKLSATVAFSEPSGNNILDAGESGRLAVTVSNGGQGDAFDVEAEVSAETAVKGLGFNKNITFGNIPAGQSVKRDVEVWAAEDLPTGEAKFLINFKEANGFESDGLKLSLRTGGFESPRLVVADVSIDDSNKDARIEPAELVEVRAKIQNMGYGNGRGVVVDVETGRNVFIGHGSKAHFELGDMTPGQVKEVRFTFYTNKQIRSGDKIPLSLKIGEARPQFGLVKELGFVMQAARKKTEEVVVAKGAEFGIKLATRLTIDVDMKIPEGKSAGEFDVAVVIGNKHYSTKAGIPDVEYADRDAKIMKEYLIRTFGFREDNVIYEEDATLGKFREIFGTGRNPRGKLFNYVKKDVSNVFIYYVGHGAPDLQTQEAYFVPVDAIPDHIADNGYRLQTFYDNLSKIPAKGVTVVLDACFSGSSASGQLFRGISPAMVRVKKEYQGPKNARVITSAAADQVSAWYPEMRHSLFTYYFLKGLGGAADSNSDGKITIGEMKLYLTDNVPYMARRLKGIDQQPVIAGNDVDVLVELRR